MLSQSIQCAWRTQASASAAIAARPSYLAFTKCQALTRSGALLALTGVLLIPGAAHADMNGVEIVTGNGFRADVIEASTTPLQGAFLWPDNSSGSQEFDLLDSGNGFYRIRARHSGQCLMLDWRAGFYANGTRIIQYPYCAEGYAASEWSTTWVWRSNGCTGDCFSTGTWYALIKNRATGRCFEAANPNGGFPSQGNVLQQWDCIASASDWNAWNQLWSFPTATSQVVPVILH